MDLEKEIIYFSLTLPFLIFAIFLIVMINGLLIHKLTSKANFYQKPKSTICIALALADTLVFFFPFIHASFNAEDNEDGTCRLTNHYTFYFLPLLHGSCLVLLGLELLLRHTIIGIGNEYLRSTISVCMGALPWVGAILTYLQFVMPSQDFNFKQNKPYLNKITALCLFIPATLAFVMLSFIIAWQCFNKQRCHAIDSLDGISIRLDSGSPTTNRAHCRHDLSTMLGTFACATAAFVVLSLISAVENYRSFVERRGQEKSLMGICMFLPVLASFSASVVSFLVLHLMLKQRDQTICSELSCFENSDSQSSKPDEKQNQFSSKQICEKFLKTYGPLQDKNSTSRPLLSSTFNYQPEKSKNNTEMCTDQGETNIKRKLDIYKGMGKLYGIICVYIAMSVPRHIFLLYETMDHNSAMFTLFDDSLMLLSMSRSFVTPIILLF